MTNKTLALTILVTSLVAGVNSASAKQCINPEDLQPRWMNDLNPHEVVSTYSPNINDLTFGEKSYFYQKQYGKTALEVCKNLIKYRYSYVSQAQKDSATIDRISDNSYYCTYDFNGDGQVYGTTTNPTPPDKWDDWSQNHAIVNIAGNAEAMCDRIPKNTPYDHLGAPWGMFGKDGGDFSESKKKAILADNKGTQLANASDAWFPNPYEPGKNVDFYGWLQQQSPDPDRRPEVDHLIPRVDRFGCACGTNAYANAIVISRRLNREMSNNSEDKRRIALLDKFTVAAREVGGEDPIDLDESTLSADELDETEDESSNEIGGCAAAGGTGGGLALVGLALALTSARRRSKA